MSILKIKKLKLRKSFVLAFKILLFAVVIYFFYKQISKLSIHQFQEINLTSSFYLFLVVVLFVANWGFEFVKWLKILRVNNIDFSFSQLQQSFFAGITTGVITPNRIGNFIGRILFFKGKIRAQLVLGTLYSNFSQFTATLIFGIFGLIFIGDIILEDYNMTFYYLAFILFVISIFFYFLIPFLPLSGIRIINRRFNVLQKFQYQSKKLCWSFLLLSIGRYLAFSLQYLFFLMAFNEPASFDLFYGICVFYLISTLIPSLFLGKLIIRETTGLIVLGFFVENSAVIVVSSLLLWFVNLAIPTLLGLFFMIKKKYLSHA